MAGLTADTSEVAAAERVCAPQLAAARDAGDLWSLGNLLEKMVVLDLNSARFADAAAHLREALQTALRTGSRARVLDDLDCCGYLCAMTGRSAEAVTIWAAVVVLQGHAGFSSRRTRICPRAGSSGRSPCGKLGGRSDPTWRRRPRIAARR